MSIIKKAPAILTREVRMEEPVSALLDDYAQFIESSPDHVVNSVLKKTLWRDPGLPQVARRAQSPARTARPGLSPNSESDHDTSCARIATFCRRGSRYGLGNGAVLWPAIP